MIELRPFQVEAIDELTTACGASGKMRLLLQAATGAGKTVIASKIIAHAASTGHRILFLAHRRELVRQAVEKLAQFGVEAATIMSGEFWDKSLAVSVASIQSLHAWCVRRTLERMPAADLLVIDEAHHIGSSETWQDIARSYPEAIILGMTATPINRRGKGLGYFFDEMVRCPSVARLTEMGYLVPAKYYVPSLPDLKGVKVQAGDYVEKQLEERMDRPKLIGDILENWARIAPQRQTLIFASGVRHSIHLVEGFKAIGVAAAHVDGETPAPERDQIIRDFSDGKIRVLSNCQVFTEGTDLPTASCLVFARPTKSLLLYLQVAGRVLRTSTGKENAVIIDHAGVVYEHGPIDQDWDWQLDYGQGDVRSESLKKMELKKEITCSVCKCVYFGRLDCPECGNKPKVQGREVATYKAYLEALDEVAHPQPNKELWYRMLLRYARQKGKKDGWAFFKFQEKFPGEKPRWSWRDMEPMEPSLEVVSWIRSRNIAWAKGMKYRAQAQSGEAPVAGAMA